MCIPYPKSPLFSCVDLFSGCGGNSWGMLHGDGRSLVPLLALDIDPVALATYHRNMPMVDVMLANIREIQPLTILNRIGLQPSELGCLIASPPCQTYSRNNRKSKKKNDSRNTLYLHTIKMIKGIRPWVVFMENVPEMETYEEGKYHKDFLQRLKKLGYKVEHWTVNAAAYGVPQHRHRLIYLAYRQEMGKTPRCPIPTHGERAGLQPWVTVEDAISDLPPRQAGDDQEWFRIDCTQKKQRSSYAIARCPSYIKFVSNHVARSLNPTQLQRLYALKEGQAFHDLPDELRPKSGYKASYGRLSRCKPAPTLTTYLAYPSCGRFSHYEQDRVITIREALRLQSFDDSFVVTGKLREQSAQVGNAVPPILATAFRKVIVDDLKDLFGVDAPKNNSNQTGHFFELPPSTQTLHPLTLIT